MSVSASRATSADYWIYENGQLTAVKKGTLLEVPYIHFMNWKPGSKIFTKGLWEATLAWG
jgi:hypothetical protein